MLKNLESLNLQNGDEQIHLSIHIFPIQNVKKDMKEKVKPSKYLLAENKKVPESKFLLKLNGRGWYYTHYYVGKEWKRGQRSGSLIHNDNGGHTEYKYTILSEKQYFAELL